MDQPKAKDEPPKPETHPAMNGTAQSAASKPSQPSIGSLTFAQLAATQKPHEPFIFIEDESAPQPAKKPNQPDEKGSIPSATSKSSTTPSSQRKLPPTLLNEADTEFDPSWWQCSLCTFVNKPPKSDFGTIRYDVCAMCENGVRPGKELPAMQLRPLPTAARVPAAAGEDQLSEAELQALAPLLQRILQLQSAPTTLLERSSSGESTHSDVVKEHDESWSCPQCTFLNDDGIGSQCSFCLMVAAGKKEALEMVLKIVQNVINNSELPKFRKIKTDKVLPRLTYGGNSTLPILLNLGFKYLSETKEFLVLPNEADLAPLREFAASMEKAIAVKQKMLKLSTERLTPEQREEAQLELFIEASKKEKENVRLLNPVAWASYMKRAARKSLSEGKWEEAIDYAKHALTFFTRSMYPVDYSHIMLYLHAAYKNRTVGDKTVNLVDAENYLAQADQPTLYPSNGCNRPDCVNCKRRRELLTAMGYLPRN